MRLHREVIKQMLALSTSGFGLASALAWNQLIQDAIENYIKPFVPASSTIVSKLLYAVIVTTLAVTITYQLTELSHRFDSPKKPGKKKQTKKR